MYQLEITRNLSEFLAAPEAWDAMSGEAPFMQSAWLGPWWESLGDDARSHVVTARDAQGALVGLLPLYQSENSRTLSLIGDGNTCSDHVTVLTKVGEEEAIAEAIGKHLAATAADSQFGWDLVDIDGVVEGNETMAAFSRGLRDGGSVLHAGSRMSTWIKPTDESWVAHLKHHGKTQRRRMRRWSEKIEATEGLERKVATTPAEAEWLLNECIRLHQKRWNDAGEPGTFAEQSFRNFIHASVQRFLASGQLYLVALVFNGEVIAGELNIIGKDQIMYSYSAGYDIDFQDMEPGRILAIDSLVELYRGDLKGLDFMRGDEAYKTRFATHPRRVFRIRAVAPTMMPRLRHAVWSTGFEVKQWMRKRTGKTLIAVKDPTTMGTVEE